MKKLGVLVALLFFINCADSGDSNGKGGKGGKGGQGGEGGDGGTAGEQGGAGGMAGDAGGDGGTAGEQGGVNGEGGDGGGMATAGSGGTPPVSGDSCTTLTGTLRNFSPSHPDFWLPHIYVPEGGDVALGPGGGLRMVKTALDGDKKPVLNVESGSWKDTRDHIQVQSKDTFAQWYRDVSGVNMSFPHSETLVPHTDGKRMVLNPGEEFLPLAGRGYPDMPQQGLPSVDRLFTYEIHAEIYYAGGETIIIESDDDSWVFINGKLAVDNGGLHNFRAGNAPLDAKAADLGITKGNRYPIAIFYADRQLPGAKFRLSTDVKFSHCWE